MTPPGISDRGTPQAIFELKIYFITFGSVLVCALIGCRCPCNGFMKCAKQITYLASKNNLDNISRGQSREHLFTDKVNDSTMTFIFRLSQ